MIEVVGDCRFGPNMGDLAQTKQHLWKTYG